MGLCQDPSEVLHEAALGQNSLTGFMQSRTSELPSCLKAGLKLSGICAAPPEIQNGLGELSSDETAGCVSYGYKERVGANNRDCLVGECANMARPILEKVSDDEVEIEIGNFCLKKEGLCMENAGVQGNDGFVISIDTHETCATHLKRNCVQAKEQRDDNGVNSPSSKGLVEEQGGSLAVMESNTRDRVSAYCEMPVELQSMAGPSHCHEQDCQEDDKVVSSTFTKRILNVMEEEHDSLVGTETLSCNQSVPPEGCGIPSESMFDSYPQKQHIQLDERKRNQCIGSPYVEGFIRASEERSGVLVGADSLSCKPLLPSEGAEVSTTCLATKSIQQGEQKDDKCIDCPFAEGVMEVKEVMSFSDQILPSHVCEILSGAMPVTILSKSCDEENVLDIKTFHALDCNIEERSGVLVGADSLSCKPLLPSEGAEVSTTCLATKSIQQGEQKDDKCIDCPFAEGVMEVKEVMSFSDQILPSHVCEILSGAMPVTILSKSCDEENVLDIKTFHALDCNIDRSYQIEAHSCNQISHPEGDEMPIKSLAGDFESSGCHDNQKSETGDSDPYPERYTKGVETKNSTETCVHILSPQYEKSDGKHVSDPSADSNSELLEEKNDSKADIRVEQNAFNSGKGFSGLAANISLERPTSPQLTGCSDVFEHSSYTSLDVKDCLRRSVFGTIDSVSAVDSFGPEDNKEINIVKVDKVSDIKISENVSLSFPRSNRTRKSSQKSNRKKAARKLRDAAKVPHRHKILEHILKSPKRKRSHFSRSARCALWGSMGNITQLFKQSNGLDYVLNQESLKSLGKRERRKRNKSGKGGSSGRSSRKSSASTGVLRLKVKVGSENCQSNLKSVIPEVLDTSASAGPNINNSGSDYCLGDGIEPSKSANGTEAEWGEEVAEKQLFSIDKYLEDAKTELDVDFHGANSDCTLVPAKLYGDGTNIGFASHMVVEALGGTIEHTYADPGTSPDSEVTNIVPDADVVAKQEEWNGSYGGAVACNKKFNLPCVGADILKTAKPLQKGGGKQKLGDNLSPCESLASSTIGTASSISSGSRDLELLSLPIETELEVPGENLKVKIGVKDEKCCDLDGHLGFSESENSQNMVYSANSERVQPSKTSKSERLSKERSKVSKLAKSRKVSASSKRGSKQKSVNKGKVKEKRAFDHTANRVDGYPDSGKHVADAIGSNNVVSISNLDMASGVVIEQGLPAESAWVSCDDCHKWRRISDALVNSIDESSPWSCKDNMDKAFADCTIPQEKSNADINAELGISYADEDVYDSILNMNGSEYKHITTVSQESSFKRIDSNEFLHRSRKNQTIDEIMVCHCKPPQDGCLGCGDQCLNRMLNIECLQGTCPCGDICSNQQFQKRQYAGMKWVRCGKKGFGLQLQQDISKGRFLIEYVGEVLDMHAYEARQREYAAKGHKHFYFMTLNGSEVIDASAKGNLGRFINHSCDPNCRTEKWVVNGEICIGLFALRDIKKGEEVTFDYNYVRVFGAAVKKCYCGSSQCRGYIGGDPHNSEVIVQGDSDEEFPEPVMLEDGKTGVHKDRSRRINSFGNEDMKSVEVAVLKSEMTTEIGDAINLTASTASQPHSSLELEASKRKSHCSSQQVEVSPQTVSASKSTSLVQKPNTPENTSCSAQVLEKSFSVDVDADESRKAKSETVKGKRVFSKSRFLIKNTHLCGSLKKGKVNGNLANENKVQMIANKPQVPSVRPKKLVEASSDGRFEAVEEKLNELLDANGGISKRKEAPKGYLKLLLLTAASGGTANGEAIQSNRDLSMILDALLKTKSRVVLVDIINKNGLRMLHNIMKQYQRDFKKIPILRKLLKVLEYLATREILAFDHINGGPPCPGMESFRESMLSLTEHDDKQVHQIARHFRDRWITKFVRKANCLDRDDRGMEFHRGSSCGRVSVSRNHWRDDAVKSTKTIDCVMQSVPVMSSVDGTVQDGSSATSAGGFKTNGAKTRKRKSRWDQPAEPKINMRSSISPKIGEVDHLEEISREDTSCLEYIQSQCQQNQVICAANGVINSPEDIPPGFSSPLKTTLVSSSTSITPQSVGHLNCPLEVVVGQSQGKFISRLPVSYGIPLPIVQQIGSPDNETLGSWVIAPGMPFRPFPPLPPYPRDTKSTAHCADKTTKEHAQVLDNLDNTGGHPHENNHSTNFPHQPEVNFQVANVQQTCKRARGSSYDLGKNYYRQQKWNKVPPWLRRSMEWGYASNNLRGGTCSIDVGNMTNEPRNPYCTQNVDHGVEKPGCYYNSHPHHHNQH